ncbi:MAG: 4-alpha-glucanotransferase [Candidatus Velamenicoccus archaeovorus]
MDLRGRRHRASREATLAVLRALGSPVDRPEDVPEAVQERRDALRGRLLEPVTVAWDGVARPLELRLPARPARATVSLRLELEDGDVREWGRRIDRLVPLPTVPEDPPLVRRVSLDALDRPGPLPLGYHRLTAELGGRSSTCLLIAAPVRAGVGLPDGAWGVFAPLFTLRSGRDWGVGDLTTLEGFLGWVEGLGGRVAGTLPLFAAFLRDPVEPSPYSPVSRLFWNELFVDVERVPDLAGSESARRLARSARTRRAVQRLRGLDLVAYGEVAALKRSVLEVLAREVHASRSARRDALEAFAREHPALDDYARFRAAGERWGVDWRAWPGPPRDGRLEPADVDEDAWRYHRYVQLVTDEQLAAVRTSSGEPGLYLDVPLGVHPDGYDVWRERESFALEASAGAPPDDFFPGGQDWGFPPLHPERIREDGYRYPIACLRRAMSRAAAVRIDHVMALHRLYWVPHGFPADQGVYVAYHPEEWYAILALESHRAGTTVVGEDLGTVPRAVRAAMRRHGLLRSYVLQMEAGPDRAPPAPPRRSLAVVNTHDMVPFAGWWRGRDVEERRALGWLSEREADAERERRAAVRERLVEALRSLGLLSDRRPAERDVLRASLSFLASSPARVVVAGLEDLWGETEPQNRPGVAGAGSWRRRGRHALEDLARLPRVADTLAEVGARRRRIARTAAARPGERSAAR